MFFTVQHKIINESYNQKLGIFTKAVYLRVILNVCVLTLCVRQLCI